MKTVFLSNYFNHHQRSLCHALYNGTNGEFAFIETSQMRQERIDLGYGENAIPEYVCHWNKERDLCKKLLDDAELIICGSVDESIVRPYILRGIICFRYQERPFKIREKWYKYPLRWLKWHYLNPRRKPVYLLCASAYAYGDYSRYGMFKGRAFRWGYFPKTILYDDVRNNKNFSEILWCARFIDWKQPEFAISLARYLKNKGYSFVLNMIGTGELLPQIQQRIEEENLRGYVNCLGSMKPDAVRKHMERAGIFLMTSNRREGWGAVLNEAMNSGCAIVACREAGSVPYLIGESMNGLSYSSESEMHLHVERLLNDFDFQNSIGRNAYKTIIEEWNAEIAANRLLSLAKRLPSDELVARNAYSSGPCSFETDVLE